MDGDKGKLEKHAYALRITPSKFGFVSAGAAAHTMHTARFTVVWMLYLSNKRRRHFIVHGQHDPPIASPVGGRNMKSGIAVVVKY